MRTSGGSPGQFKTSIDISHGLELLSITQKGQLGTVFLAFLGTIFVAEKFKIDKTQLYLLNADVLPSCINVFMVQAFIFHER